MTRTILTLVLGGLLMATPGAKAQTTDDEGQDTPAEEPDPIVEALERKKKIAELEKAIAEAEKAKLAAKLPTTEGSGITGSVTFGTGSGYFAEVLAYQAMVDLAKKVAEGIGSSQPAGQKVLVVLDDNLAKSAQLWEIANVRVEDANQRLAALLARYPPDFAFQTDESVAAAFTTVSALLGAAADIASFFRSDLTVTARTVNVTSTALVAATAAELGAKGWQPVLPASSLKKTLLLGKIETLLTSRRQLADRRHQLEQNVQPDLLTLTTLGLELEAAEAALAKAKAAKPADPPAVAAAEKKVLDLKIKILPFATKKARWEKVAAEIDATLTATDALVKALVEGAEGKPSAVEVVGAADVAKSNPNLKLLRLEISSQGGEMHVSKSAWRTRLTYVGGVAVTYLLMNQEGGVEKSGVVGKTGAKSTPARDASTDLVISTHQ